MTVHQLPYRCWELQPPTDDEWNAHYDTEADALAALDVDRGGDGAAFADTKPVQLAAPCWLVQCDGECEIVLDTEDEGYTIHHDSRADAEQTMTVYEWSYRGDLVFCAEDAPDGSEVPPPSPAQQEAAGQLSLLGTDPGPSR